MSKFSHHGWIRIEKPGKVGMMEWSWFGTDTSIGDIVLSGVI